MTLLRHRRVRGACVGGYEQHPPRGRLLARGTKAVTDGDEGVGGLHTSADAGERGWHPDPAEPRRPVWG